MSKEKKVKRNESKEIKWRRLDNSAKIFPISTGKKYSTVFRFSVVLNEKIDKDKLIDAVNMALNIYKPFKARMKTGLFWYYLETNPNDPIIEEEKEYPCKYINPKENNNYLFKVTYFENKTKI